MNILKWFLRFLIDTAAALPIILFGFIFHGGDLGYGAPDWLLLFLMALGPILFGLLNSLIGIFRAKHERYNWLKWFVANGHTGIITTTLKFNLFALIVWLMLNAGIIIVLSSTYFLPSVKDVFDLLLTFVPVVIVSMLTTRFIAHKG